MKESDRRRRVHAALQRALADVTLATEEYAEIRTWINEELPQFLAAGTDTALVFGSYRRGYHRSLRIVQYELNKEVTVTAVVLGDTPSLGFSIGEDRQDPLEFVIRFHLLTEFADRNVAVYEKDSGGEAVELGMLRQDHCFSRTVVLPRGYHGVGRESFNSTETVLAVARHIAGAEGLNDDQRRAELRGLVAAAREDGLEVTDEDVMAVLEEHQEDSPSYSWVHLAMFRRFEEAGRCYPWHTESELRDAANEIARASTPS